MREREKFYLKSRFQWRTEKWGVRIMEAKKYRRIFTIPVESVEQKMQNVSAMRELTR